MGLYSAGDRIACKVGYGQIFPVGAAEFEIIRHFDIVCECDGGYLILVGNNIYLSSSFALSAKDCRLLRLPTKFIDGVVHPITDDHVVGLVQKMTGLACYACGEYAEFAEVNSLDENGKGILICYLCRSKG